MSAVLLIVIVSLLTSYLLWSRRHLYYLSWKFGGRMGYPLIGSFFDFLNVFDFGEYLKNVIWRKYNSPCVNWVGGKMHILVRDPEYAQLVLTSSNILDKHSVYELYHPVGGKNGINFSKGDSWTLQRRILNTSLNLKRVNKLMPGFSVAFEKYINHYFKPALNKGAVDLYEGLQRTVFSLTFETIAGKSLSWVESQANASMHDLITVAQRNIEDRTLKVYLHSDFTYKLTENYKATMAIVGKIQDNLKSFVFDNQTEEGLEFTEPGDAVIDVIQSNNDKPGFSDSDARSQVYQLLIASYETTVFTLYMIMVHMALFPEHQEKVYEELKSLFPDGKVKLGADNLGGLVFTEMFINEVLRMHPPIPLFGRTCTKDTLLSNGTFIPKGAEFLFDLKGLHRNEKYWGPDADKFNPDNFLPENKETRPASAFIPFSLGTRNCIGIRYAKISLKIAVVKIFRNFRLETPNKFDDLKPKRGLTMTVGTPVTFRVFERSE